MSFCFSFSLRTICFDLSGGPFVEFVFSSGKVRSAGVSTRNLGFLWAVKTRWPHQTTTNTHQSGLNPSLTSDPVAKCRKREVLTCFVPGNHGVDVQSADGHANKRF